MNKNKFYEQLKLYMGEPVKDLGINRFIYGCLTSDKPKVYYKIKAQKPYIAVSFKASRSDLDVKMTNAGTCEEIKIYGESKTQTDALIFPELFKSFDAGKHSASGYVYTYLFPVTVSDVYLLSLSAEGLSSDESLFALRAVYLC